MDGENQTLFPYHSSLNGSSSSTPDVLPPASHSHRPARHITGTIMPNRIFVGGIEHKMNESDLLHLFSQFGPVREAKIILDRAGVSKRYGFVTFETREDALRILNDPREICFQDKRLCIAQAFRRHSSPFKVIPVPHPEEVRPPQMSYGTLYLTTATGNPYTYHNGVAYFHCPQVNPENTQWTPTPQVVLSQSHQLIHPTQPYQYYQGYAPYQWNTMQVPIAPGTLVYAQQSEYVYQAGEASGFQAPAPTMEDSTFEFPEAAAAPPPPAPHVYAGMPPFIVHHDPTQSFMFSPPLVHFKPELHCYFSKKNRPFLADSTDLASGAPYFPFPGAVVG